MGPRPSHAAIHAVACLSLLGACAHEAASPCATPSAASAQNSATTRAPDLPEARERAISVLLLIARTGLPEERCNAIEGLLPTPARLATVIEPALTDESEA